MKELFIELADYNLWANQQLLKLILSLSEEQQNMELKSSFPSLRKTALHMIDAEHIWWQRMKLQERITRPSDDFKGSMNDISQDLFQINNQWKDWIVGMQEHMLQHEFIYQNSKTEKFKKPIYQMLLHIFNHGTYHRGQIVNMLRQIGVEKIPQTDFIVFSRKK
ncbi:MAG TPA: DinB family protein [Flavisolibacter sp.]|nr:DinB family protein [Flavisolibacter sp.]